MTGVNRVEADAGQDGEDVGLQTPPRGECNSKADGDIRSHKRSQHDETTEHL